MARMHCSAAVGSWLLLAGVSLGCAVAQAPQPAEKKGTAVEVQLQDNSRVQFELQEILPAYNDPARMSFTKEIKPLREIAWSEIPIAPNPKRGAPIREIRIADEGQKVKDPADGQEYLFYSVVLVPFEGTTASWYWQASKLAGVARSLGSQPRPVSIPVSDIKVVRFKREQGS